jgi:hypothetical protein
VLGMRKYYKDLTCYDSGFEPSRWHGYFYLVNVMYCCRQRSLRLAENTSRQVLLIVCVFCVIYTYNGEVESDWTKKQRKRKKKRKET